MMSKNVTAYAKDSLSVSPDIRAILPDIMIDYLWELALNSNWRRYESQTFELEAGELSGHVIQKNVYHTGYGSNPMDKRRVYGVDPVNCILQVVNSHGNYQMQLCMS